MWPWGHLAVGYLSYSAWVHVRDRHAPESLPTVALVFGTQFPDLVDKPLAWSLDVLPYGRTLAHSLFVAAAIVGVVSVVLRNRDQGRVVTAFSLGYATHLVADALYPLLAGDYESAGFLLWPVVPAAGYATDQDFLGHVQSLTLTFPAFLELVAALGVFVLWTRDGAPGIAVLRLVPSWVTRHFSA